MPNYATLQNSIRHLSKKDAVEYLHQQYPANSKRWYSRNLHHLMALNEHSFYEAITYNDPTPKNAIRNIEKQAA